MRFGRVFLFGMLVMGGLRASFERETTMLFETIMSEDRSIVDLLNPDFTFVDERLAKHYGIPNIRGGRFRRVTLEEESPRRGLLGQGSILVVTSSANRTSPVQRGKWILENVLGMAPPAPPPGVETNLDVTAEVKQQVTLRQRMEQHRANAVCASCHSLMDPIGFSMENFDLIGKWRDREGKTAIDATAQLVDGTMLDGPVSLRRASEEQRRARRQQSRSLLDSVLKQVGSLEKDLPPVDRERLDQYMTDIREIERRIQRASASITSDLKVPGMPVGIPDNFEDHIKLMVDLQVLAWQADITRVTTVMMAQELGGAVYPASGIREAFHNLSHHSQVRANLDKLAVLNTYHVTTMSYLLQKLKATPDGDGNLLDHSVVLYGSGVGNSNQHDHEDLPIVLLGGASGQLKGSRHLVFPAKTTMSNLLLAVLDKFGIPIEKFGDSTGKLEI